MNKEEVLKLAKLARVEVSQDEAESLSRDFGAILDYVSEINEAKVPALKNDLVLKNVMREDENAHDSGIYTEALLNEAPSREGSFVKVKKIL